MNKKLKQALKLGFEAPAPKNKDKFIKSLDVPKLTYRDFFFSQLLYIRKRVWLFSTAVIFLLIILSVINKADNMLVSGSSIFWLTSALVPILALFTVTELSRSSSYNMFEIETSCRYNLSQIAMARFTILGISNLILLFICVFALGSLTKTHFVSIGLYIFVPYLLTCAASIYMLNRVRGSDSIYCCVAIAFAVSLSDIILKQTQVFLFTPQYILVWVAVFAVFVLILSLQIINFIKATKDPKWSLILSD